MFFVDVRYAVTIVIRILGIWRAVFVRVNNYGLGKDVASSIVSVGDDLLAVVVINRRQTVNVVIGIGHRCGNGLRTEGEREQKADIQPPTSCVLNRIVS